VMYWVWWDKPLNVRRAVLVYKKPDRNDPSTDGLVATKEGGFWPPLRRSLSALQSEIAGWGDMGWHLVWMVPVLAVLALYRVIGGNDEDDIIVDEKRIATFYPPSSTKWKSAKADFFIIISVTSIAVVFGAIHCFAWPFPFPSGTERILWRVSSVVITGAPIAAVLVWAPGRRLDSDSWVNVVSALILVGGAIAYTISRVSLLVLAFLSLRALPPDAYRSVQWTSLIPHF
jgi:hypothetical protein